MRVEFEADVVSRELMRVAYDVDAVSSVPMREP